MKPRFAPSAFVVAFCCAYGCVFALNWPLFLYYPLHGDITWGKHALTGAGPAMAWYGLMADAGIVAAISAVCIPERAADWLLRGYLWLFPCLAMLVCVFLLRQLFA